MFIVMKYVASLLQHTFKLCCPYSTQQKYKLFQVLAKKLKKIFSQHDALLFALPEYNSSLSGVFKNTIDWLSRSSSSTPDLSCFSGKVCALISASPGKLGGMRGLVHARSMLESINVMVMPEQICVGDALEAIGIDGVKDDKIRTSLEKLGLSLTRLTQRISFRATQHI